MKVLVIGNGAREHALVWKISQSPKVDGLFAAPGNAGTATIARNLSISPSDIPTLVRAAQDHKIDLVVVGPEAPLTLGLVDALQDVGIAAFGPRKGAARIEGSKVFAKELMLRHSIPCARSATFDSFEEAQRYLKNHPLPVVVKADGLAAGKGVIIAHTYGEAEQALDDIMNKRAFGVAGERVLIEECLTGREASLLAFTDGDTVIDMLPACDYKRALDGDQGLNTGGMGGYCPSEFFSPELRDRVMATILKPVVKAMAAEGNLYKGVLYAGLMMTAQGPKVLEFNARFGDPETQVILPLLRTDLVDIVQAVVDGALHKINIEWSRDACVGVVMASQGYPGNYKTGFPISGLADVDPDVQVFHAGTASQNGKVVTAGGRVLTVAAAASDYTGARQKVYRNLPKIAFEGCQYRRDIGIIKCQVQGAHVCR